MKTVAQTKISAALRVLNSIMPRPRLRRYRIRVNAGDWTCPVCHKPECNKPWSEQAHAQTT